MRQCTAILELRLLAAGLRLHSFTFVGTETQLRPLVMFVSFGSRPYSVASIAHENLGACELSCSHCGKLVQTHTLVSFLIYGFRFLNSVLYVRGNP